MAISKTFQKIEDLGTILLHQYLYEKFGEYDIFCYCPGYLYNITMDHDHFQSNGPDWILIVSSRYDEYGNQRSVIDLYDTPGASYRSREISWHDPKGFEKIASHIANWIEIRKPAKRDTATI